MRGCVSLFFLLLSFCCCDNSTIYVQTANGTSIMISSVTEAVSITTLIQSHGVGKESLHIVFSQSQSIGYPNNNLISELGPVPCIIISAVNSISNLDLANAQFEADFYLQLYWPDSSLCSNLTMQNCVFDSNNNWNPSIELINLVGDAVQYVSSPYSIVLPPTSILNQVLNASGLPVNFSGWGNTWVLYEQRFYGTFSQDYNLVDFPYDQQNLAIKIESAQFDESQLKFYFTEQQASLLLPGGFSVTEWDLRIPNAASLVLTHSYSLFGNYSRAVLAIQIQRQTYYYVQKYVVIIIFMVLLDLLCFALNVDCSDRMMGTVTIFLAFVLFLFSNSQSLPKISYLTRLDQFLGISMIFVFATLCAHAVLYLLYEISLWGEQVSDEIKEAANKLHVNIVGSEEVNTIAEVTPRNHVVPSSLSAFATGSSIKIVPITSTGTRVGRSEFLDNRLISMGLATIPPLSNSLWEKFNSLNLYRKLDILIVVAAAVTYILFLFAILIQPTATPSTEY